jgi:hypothetical protein
MMSLFKKIVHEMKDVLNGITSLNLLGSEQRLLPMTTDVVSNTNADENQIDEIDESQGVKNTQDKLHVSLSDQYVKSTRKNIRSLPLKNVQHTNEPDPRHLSNTNSVPNVKNTPKYFQETLLNELRFPFPVKGSYYLRRTVMSCSHSRTVYNCPVLEENLKIGYRTVEILLNISRRHFLTT